MNDIKVGDLVSIIRPSIFDRKLARGTMSVVREIDAWIWIEPAGPDPIVYSEDWKQKYPRLGTGPDFTSGWNYKSLKVLYHNFASIPPTECNSRISLI